MRASGRSVPRYIAIESSFDSFATKAKNLRCLTTPYVQHIDSIRNCVKSTFNLVPAPARACRLADLSLLTRSRCDHDGRQRSAHVFSRTTWERKTKQ